MRRNNPFKASLFGALISLTLGFVTTAQSAPLKLETSPLFLSNQADPNVFFLIDDSGSMDWEILSKPHPSPGFGGTTLTNGLMYEGGFRYEIYLYGNSDNAYNNGADEVTTDWRARCSCLNVLAYNPTVTYSPWVGYPDAIITAAKSDPHSSKSGYSITRNLTTDNYYTGWVDSNTNTMVDTTDAKTTVLVSSLSASEQTNYANWYQYHRRRSFVAKASVASVIDQNSNFRYGLSVINSWASLFIETPASTVTSYTTHNNSIVSSLNNFVWPNFGTPLRSALKRTGDYFDNNLTGKSDPIISECQKNFTILFTDGYWNGANPSIGDHDGDGQSHTLADVAYDYYDRDLSPFPNNVPVDTFDTNPRQHMVTFTVAFGIDGLLNDTDNDGWPNPALAESGNWGNPYNSNAEKVDDLWHAAFNSKGTFVAAQTPQAVSDGVNNALANIASRTSSAASVALNAGSIGTNSRVYQAKFDTTKWSGQLLSFTVNTNGTVNPTPNWDAGCKLTGGTCPTTAGTESTQNWDTGREIITFKPSNGNGIPFRWPAAIATPTATELDVAQTNALDINLTTGLADGNAMSRWRFLRGDTTISGFRNRDSVLGDIVNAAPVYVGPPNSNYSDTLETAPYSTFRNTYQNRKPIVWFGANDGIFHGINAKTGDTNVGKEVLGYVPGLVYTNLHALTSPSYKHQYYVDGVPSAGDVFIGGKWETVVVSGLGGGGQGLFALKVTDPTQLNETNANDISLWEFSDSNDSDMGYSFGQPSIVKLHNGKWAAVFGNGYNNTQSDGNASVTGNSVIYIVDVETGAIIKKFDTGVGTSADPLALSRPNGMASPTVVDVDNNKIADFIFAGDLFGNVWKIDITNSSPSNWKFDYSTTAPHSPLFVTDDGTGLAQPITTSPEVSKHPKGGYLIHIGTGKYLETGDDTQIGQQTQTFYGIWDKDEASLTAFNRSHMLQQEIIQEIVEDFDTNQNGTRGDTGDEQTEVRETTDHAITWYTGSGLPTISTEYLGWYMDLFNTDKDPITNLTTNTNNYGERQVTNATLIDGLLVFNTLVPSSNPCNFGGDSWIVALDSESGARYVESVFDLDSNGTFDLFDGIQASNAHSGVDTVVSMTKSKVGILPRLTFAKGYGGDTNVAFGSGSSGGFMTQQLKRSPSAFGRQSWDQILE